MNNPVSISWAIIIDRNNTTAFNGHPINNPFDPNWRRIVNYLHNKKIRDRIYRNKTKLKK